MDEVLHRLIRFDGRDSFRGFAEVPASCPACAYYVSPRPLSAHSICRDDTAVEFVFQCPRAKCRRVFVAEYRQGADLSYELLHALILGTPVEAELVPA